MPMYRGARLAESIAFEKRLLVFDDLGNVEGAFETQFVASASIVAKFGGEAVTAARLSGQQPVIITVRQWSQTRLVTTDWRIRDTRAGTLYNIRSIADPYGDRLWFEMLCQSGVAT